MASILYLVKDKVKVALGGGRPLAVNDVQVSTLVMNISTLRQRRQEAQASAVNTISEVPVSEAVSPEINNTISVETPAMDPSATPVQETNMNMTMPTPENPVIPEPTLTTNEAPVMDAPVEPQAMETPVTPVQDSVSMEMPTPESSVIPEVAPVMPEATPITNEAPVMDAPVEPQAVETPEVPVQDSVSMEMPTPESSVIPEVTPVMPEATPTTNEAPVMDAPVEPQTVEAPVTPVQDSINIAMPTPESPVIPEVAPVMPEATPITNEAPVMDTQVEPQALETPVQDSVNMAMPTPENPVISEVTPVMPEATPITNEAPVMDTPVEPQALETPEVPVQDSVSMEMPTPETPVGVEIIESEKEENALLKELESIHEKYNEQRKMIDEEEEKEVNAFFQRHSEEMTQKQNIIQEQLKNAEAVTEIARQTQENLNKVNAENVISFPENQDVGTSPVQGDTMTLGLEKMAA